MAIDRPYTAQTWATGDVITKDKLKNIEDAIAAIDSEVTGARGYGASSGTLGKRIDDLVMIQDTQPTSANNEIWVRSTGNGVQVPTYEEFEDLVENTMHLDEQTLTSTQKEQARENIDAASVDDLKSALVQNYADVINIEQGYWAIADGTPTNSSSWCRTNKFINKDTIVKTTTSYMWLLAYSKISGDYVGTWDGSQFGTTYVSGLKILEINIADYVKNYPNYVFAIDFKRTSGNISPSDVYSELTIESEKEKEIKQVAGVSSVLDKYGSTNKSYPLYGIYNPGSLTVIWEGTVADISGSPTGSGYTHSNSYNNNSAFPDGLGADMEMQVNHVCADSNVHFRVYEYVSGSENMLCDIAGTGIAQIKFNNSATGCIIRISVANGHTYNHVKSYNYIFTTLTKQQIETGLGKIIDPLNNGTPLSGSVSPVSSGVRYTTIDKLTLYAGRKYRLTTYADSSMNSTANIQVRVGATNLFSFSSVNANSIKVNEFIPENTVTDAYIAHYNYSTAGTIYDRLEIADNVYEVPMIYRNQLNSKVPAILGNMDDAGVNGETFIFITDLHWETNFQNSPSLIKYILDNTNISNLLCGGDIINQGEPDDMKAVITNAINAFNFKNVFFPCAVGNHDDNSNQSSASKIFPQSVVYSRMLKQIREHATLVTFGPWNYYYDLQNTKTRVIILDTGSDGSFNNYSELYAMLSDAPSGYHILILAHWLYNNGAKSIFCTNLETIVDAYNSRGSGTVGGVAYNFANASASVSIIIAGHTHTDMDWTTNNGVPVVLSDCDSALRTLSSMEFGTTDEQCFDVITLDYNNGTAKFVRIGRGSDRTFQI